MLRDEVMALPDGSWVVIDEVQKLPALLDEVHALIFDRAGGVAFALSGSSARKLKKAEANLLAGRALTRRISVLSCLELGNDFRLERTLRFGMLPAVVAEPDDASRAERLDAYVETYLREEIQQEALVRNLNSFARFLQVAGIADGQILNTSSVARDIEVSRSTVQGYFEILTETLIGWSLPAFRLRAKIKEISHPKFYFFDVGVRRAVTGEQRNPPSAAELGYLFESFILNEIRMITAYRGIGAEMSYWRTEAGTEVDLIWHRGARRIGFGIKHKDTWTTKDSAGLETLLEEKKISQAFGIYRGHRRMKQGGVSILPFAEALRAIENGEIGFG